MEKDCINRAFRQAYDFMVAHQDEKDCAKLASYVQEESAKCNSDCFTMRLILAVYDYLGAECEREIL